MKDKQIDLCLICIHVIPCFLCGFRNSIHNLISERSY